MLKKLAMVAFLAAVFSLTLVVSVSSVSAQAAACWEQIFEEVTVQFGGQTITYDKHVDTEFDDDCLRIEDGRVNNHDLAAGGAIYCGEGGAVSIWDIGILGEGNLILAVSPRDIAAVPNPPEVNTLIAEAGGFRLYRLTSGELQVNGPGIYSTDPEYVFIWSGCPA
jgi:hypothetical protein